MPLSLNPRVWIGLAAAFLALTIFFAICFYFSLIFLALALGLCLIQLVNRLRGDFSAKMAPYHLSARRRRVHATIIATLWIISAVYAVSASLDDLNAAFERMRPGAFSWQSFYDLGVRPYVPREIRTSAYFQEIFGAAGEYLTASLKSRFALAPALLLNCLLLWPPMFYQYFARGGHIYERLQRLIPDEFRASFDVAATDTGRQLNGYLTAAVIEAVVVGALCCLGFYIGGVRGWLALGVLAGFANMVPIVGPILGVIAPVMISLALRDPTAAAAALLTVVIARMVDDWILVPGFVSRKVQVNPMLTMLLLLMGASALGAVGMVFAVPVYLVYRVMLTETYDALVRIYDPARVRRTEDEAAAESLAASANAPPAQSTPASARSR